MNDTQGSHELATRYAKVPASLNTRGTNYPLPAFEPADPAVLQGKRILIISADGPELPEIEVPLSYLRARGATVVLGGQNWIFQYRTPPGCIVVAQWLADDLCVQADVALKDVSVATWDAGTRQYLANFDAIFIPGGAWNPDMLRTDEDALRIVREARAHGVLIVSLCHGPQVLISANAGQLDPGATFPRGTQLTGVGSIRVDLRNAGFEVLDQPTVYDIGCRLLTARDPHDLGPLCEAMKSLLLGDAT